MLMIPLRTFILICFIALSYASEEFNEEYARQRRQIVTKVDQESFARQNEYNFCLFQNKTLPCLPYHICKSNRGAFISYCGDSEDVCCYVAKTCDSYIRRSHGLIFHNPSFPDNDEEARFCKLDVEIQDEICALRIEFSVFELASFEKDFCPSDSFLILGTHSVVAPMCGNLTGYSSTIEVESSTVLELGFSLQGTVPYRFFLELVMLPCHDIYPFASPLQAGTRNADAKRYVPPLLLAALAALKQRVEEDGNSTEINNTTATDLTDITTTESSDIYTTEEARKVEKDYEVVIKAQNSDSKKYDKSIITDRINVFPQSSIFQKIFDEKAGQKTCGMYEAPTTTMDIARSELPIPIDDSPDLSCWSYDSGSQEYVYAEDCTHMEAREEPSFRIIKGKFAKLNEYPWQVAIINNKTFVCGGALISNRHIITAAHCFHGGFKKGLDNLYVSLGDHDLSTKNDTNNTVRHVKRILTNMHYFPLQVTNDIAILELAEPVKYSYNVRPIKIPVDTNELYENQTVTVAGWGRFNTKSRKTSPILKKFTSTVTSIVKCVESWKDIKKISAIKDMHICLNISKGSPCHGDSGGPLISCNNDHCTIVGVVSFAFPLCKDVGLPAVFTRITAFKRWMDINMSPVFYTERFSDDINN